jgi:hypothetical protein
MACCGSRKSCGTQAALVAVVPIILVLAAGALGIALIACIVKLIV